MENEIMNKEEVINGIVETGKYSGLKKGALVVGAAGVAVGLGFGIYKLAKKLFAKIKSKKTKKQEQVEGFDFASDMTTESLDDLLKKEEIK